MGSSSGIGKRLFSSPKLIDWGPSVCYVLGVTGLEREANHSPASSDLVQNKWSCTYTDTIRFYGADRVECTF